MKLQTVIKAGRNTLVVLAVFLAGDWLAFVPSAKEPPYQFVSAWGEKGGGASQFNDPTGMAVAGDEVFVSDARNGRIQVFGLDGSAKRIIGKPGNGPGDFSAPGAFAVAPNGDLLVADFYNQRIQQLKPDGSFVRQWRTTGKIGIWAGEFNYPTDLSFGPDGTLYVADGYNDRIQVFAADGAFRRKWGGPSPSTSSARSMAGSPP